MIDDKQYLIQPQLAGTNEIYDSYLKFQSHSQFYSLYCTYFEKYLHKISYIINNSSIRQKFIKNNIIYHPQNFQQPICDLITSQHHQLISQAHVKIGYFQMTLEILYENKRKQLKVNNISSSFGIIMDLQIDNQIVAIKSIQIKNSQDRNKILANVIKQYCCLKISSVLGFSPKVENYLGFDLVVFENCIQFAMQKVEQLKKLTFESEQILKQSLLSMHMMHIIHFDIKPSNIAYSKIQKRPIFLDYGLSQIVKERQGQKTLTGFRGSLAFCSQQMLAIFYDYQQLHLIDGYYNDMICLQNSFELIRQIQQKKQSEICEQNPVFLINEQQKISSPQIYLISLGKYLLYKMKYQQFKNLMLNQLKPYIKQIFQFLQSAISYPDLSNFFLKNFNQLKHFDGYQFLYSKFALKSRISNKYFKQTNLQMPYKQIIRLSLNINQRRINYCQQQIYRILQNPSQYQCCNLQQYFNLFIKMIRFDTSSMNVSLQNKIKYGISFCKFIIKDQILCLNQSQGYLIFIKIIQYLMNYILTLPFTTWKRQNILIILMQFIILDCNFEPIFQAFNQKMNNTCISIEQYINMFLQIEKIKKLLLLKHSSKYPQSLYILHTYLEDLYQQMFDRIINSGQRQGNIMRGILLKMLKCNNYEYDQMKKYYGQQLYLLKDYKLINKIQKFIHANQLYIRISFGTANSCFQYLQYMKAYFTTKVIINYKNIIIFDFGLYQLIIIMKAINNTSQLQRIGKLLKDSFGFDQSYQHFKIQMLIFLSKDCKDIDQLILFANQVVNCPLSIKNQLISAEYVLMWKRLCHFHYLSQLHPQLFMSYLSKLQILLCQTKYQELTFPNIVNQSHMLQLAVNFKQDKKQFINFILQNILNSLKQADEYAQPMIKMKYLIFAVNLHKSIDQCQKIYQYLIQLLNLSDKIRDTNLLSFCYINLYLAAYYTNRQCKQSQYLKNYIYLCHKIRQFKGFFAVPKLDLIYKVCILLANDSSILSVSQFMKDCAWFIILYPIKQYFTHWIVSMSKFKQQYEQYFTSEYLIQIFPNKITQKNPYLIYYFILSLQDCKQRDIKQKLLMKIGLRVKRLEQFIKSYILTIYYRQFIPLIINNRRRVLCLIQKQSRYWKIEFIKRYFKNNNKLYINRYDIQNQRYIIKLRQNCKKIKLL